MFAEGPGPTELVLALAKEVERTRQCKSRQVFRVVFMTWCTGTYPGYLGAALTCAAP